MRALAEYVMRGRVQAASVALLCTFLPLISPAVIALVSLRRGMADGANIALWAMLPVIVFTAMNPAVMPISFISFSVIVALIGGAIVLKAGMYWPASVLALLFLAATGGVVFGWSFPEYLDELIKTLNQAQQEAMKASGIAESEIQITPFTHGMLAGVVAFAIAINAIAALFIGRWWQGVLYNPGGFQKEMHRFQMSKTQSLFCLGVFCISFTEPSMTFWGLLAAIPLYMVAASIVHHRIAQKQQGVQWLILFYIVSIAVKPVFWIALVFGVLDAWMDFRRLAQEYLEEQKQPSENDNESND